MNTALRASAVAALSLLIVGLMPITSQAAKAGNKKPVHVAGDVTAVSSTTITILEKKTNVSTVVSVDDSTKYKQSKNVGINGLAVGDKIRAAEAPDAAPAGDTVTATRIEVLSPLAEPSKKSGKHSVEGTVTALTPNITIDGDDGTSYTIMTTAKTHVMASEPAVFSDVTVGKHVTAIGKNQASVFTASEVTIAAPKEGHGKKNKNLVL